MVHWFLVPLRADEGSARLCLWAKGVLGQKEQRRKLKDPPSSLSLGLALACRCVRVRAGLASMHRVSKLVFKLLQSQAVPLSGTGYDWYCNIS